MPCVIRQTISIGAGNARSLRLNAIISTMSFFTSSRERRLWLWILAVMVAIYTTLGTAGLLAAVLRERNLLRLSNAVVLLLAAGIIVWQWVKRRPGRGEIGVTIGVAVAYWWSWIRIQTPEERTHLFEYGI